MPELMVIGLFFIMQQPFLWSLTCLVNAAEGVRLKQLGQGLNRSATSTLRAVNAPC